MARVLISGRGALVLLQASAFALAVLPRQSYPEVEVEEYGKGEGADGAAFYWYNELSGQATWKHPAEGYRDDNGVTYYLNPTTGETQWETPAEFSWDTSYSHQYNREYYVNSITGETVWNKPEILAWVQVPIKTKPSSVL